MTPHDHMMMRSMTTPPGTPPKDASGVSEVIGSGRSLSSLSPPSRTASDGWGKLAERPNASRVDFLRDVGRFGLALSHRSVTSETPKCRFRNSGTPLENSHFDPGAPQKENSENVAHRREFGLG